MNEGGVGGKGEKWEEAVETHVAHKGSCDEYLHTKVILFCGTAELYPYFAT